ncbi:heat stress transcription factor A-1-like [Typha angustifolia]|uniref:heat stress transcription factor A-1-like n=1 Tax=Typha angustifolia TaxID=59011 RepID=UPI003C2FF1BE
MEANAATGGAVAPMVPPFLTKCYDMVDDPETDAIVSWSMSNNSFVLWDPHTFSRDLLPKYFKHSNLSSFVRQLNTYGFHKVDPDRWEFANEGFLRGQKHLLKTITRRKPSHNAAQLQQLQGKNTSVNACVEVGNFGFTEEIERLKRDKTILMQELVKLRQHQQATDLELQSLRLRLQRMEKNQQQMVSFLARAVQNPSFLAQLVEQNVNNRQRPEANKKRRLTDRQDGFIGSLEPSSDGQIIRYQPFMAEVFSSATPPESDADLSGNLQPLSNEVNNLYTDGEPTGVSPALSAGDFALTDYFEQLLASPPPEYSEQSYPQSLNVPDFTIDDFELPEQEIQMEEPQKIILPNEHEGGIDLAPVMDGNHKLAY